MYKYKFLIFFLTVILFGCAQDSPKIEKGKIDPKDPLDMLGVDFAKKLKVKLQFYYMNNQDTLDEVTLIKEKNDLRVIINGHIFELDSAKPVKSTRYIIEDLASVVNSYPHLDIRVYGHSGKDGTDKERQDLSDNRAIAVAQILYELDNKNDTLAKGCSDRKPLFAIDSDEHIISNGRVEIFFYIDSKKAKDQCR
jgi:outer membrane protein OmpA-like peptidoglycan-associated protein